jgi:hypothetical protein
MSDAIAAVSANRGIRGSHDERRLTAHWPTIKPAPVATVAPPAIKIEGRVLAKFADYDGLWGAVRARADEMGITRLELDFHAKLQDGYSAKILGPSKIKSMGTKSLGGILGGTGTYLVLVEDSQATAKIVARAKKRKQP